MDYVKQEPEEKLLLIDTDAGTDDAWAICLALAVHKASSTTGVKIVGLTTTCGNTSVDNVSINVTRTLQTVNENEIPIYQGMSEFLMGPFKHIDDPPYHGEDGFGDAGLPAIPPRVEAEHGVDAIIRLAEEYKGRLTLVALGPLTNLAMAVKRKPEITNFLREVFILGGNMDGLGNVPSQPSAEFNFFADPEAAAITVGSYSPCPIYILPWEICLKSTSTYAFRMDRLGTMNTPQVQLLNAVEATHLGNNKETWLPPDAVTMACAIDSKLILAQENHIANVELNGTRTRGMLVVDKTKLSELPTNVILITEVDQVAYENLLIWAASGVPTNLM